MPGYDFVDYVESRIELYKKALKITDKTIMDRVNIGSTSRNYTNETITTLALYQEYIGWLECTMEGKSDTSFSMSASFLIEQLKIINAYQILLLSRNPLFSGSLVRVPEKIAQINKDQTYTFQHDIEAYAKTIDAKLYNNILSDVHMYRKKGIFNLFANNDVFINAATPDILNSQNQFDELNLDPDFNKYKRESIDRTLSEPHTTLNTQIYNKIKSEQQPQCDNKLNEAIKETTDYIINSRFGLFYWRNPSNNPTFFPKKDNGAIKAVDINSFSYSLNKKNLSHKY